MVMNAHLCTVSIVVSVIVAVVLHQPMIGVLLLASSLLTAVLARDLGPASWVIFGAKLGLLAVVSVLVPIVFDAEILPVNPDQLFYVVTAERIAERIADANPLAVDYAEIVGLHNLLYSVLLGWLAFLNGSASVLLYRVFNAFLSMVLAGLGYALARAVFPVARKTWLYAFLGCSLLPSVNAYTMFVLRDVLIGVLVLLIAVSLYGRRYWLALGGLLLAFYTRIQLSFLLVGACGLYAGFGLARRLGRWAPALRGALVVGFVVAGYFIAPLVLPPEYDYTQAWNLAGFGRFLLRFVPSFVGLDFLLVAPEGLELGRSTLAIVRLVMIDTWAVPLLFLLGVLLFRKMATRWREFYLWTLALVLGYAAGYWIAYGALMVRLWVPLYPLLLVAAVPVSEELLRRAQLLSARARASEPPDEG